MSARGRLIIAPTSSIDLFLNFATRLCLRVIYFSKKKPPTFVGGFLCSRYLSSRVGQGLSLRKNMPVACFSKKKPPTFVGGFLCSRYLSFWAGQVLSCRPQVSGGHLQAEKKPRPSSRGFVFALPIFPGSHPPSIVGVHVLNFCVRDGNRWTHMTINTNYSGYTLKTEHCILFCITQDIH